MNRRHDSDDMLAAGKYADRGFRQPQRSCHGVHSKSRMEFPYPGRLCSTVSGCPQ